MAATGVVGVMTSAMGAAAATWENYSANVPTFSDYETSTITKTTTGSAYNEVGYIEKDGKLVSWIEDASGSNISSKVSYSTTGRKTMDYTAASTWKDKKVRLNISTSSGTFEDIQTSGEWTPN
ncbi:hypothetical protein I6G82_08800 [Lysinibacillus macroides]|uniref:DUF5640 domain-containing protein n=1 Tax=Lysinibacillus macroides TaxID=33935 RepID=A0A0M9DFN8_9BACI|nr:hypothetical protein [Lysinibacillus macroides]KOY80528.1 hypothetical protein ADM90_15030 [Lysinibacillus macroides]QPR69661.1 hypothetical protein I6G82_08800 [Lysinibacillus macroides]